MNQDTKRYDPKYIVVPNYFVANPSVKPNKIPIAIRSKMAYNNLAKQVVFIDMVVQWNPEPAVVPPQPPKPPVLPDMNYTITPVKNQSAQPNNTSKPGFQQPNQTSSEDPSSAVFNLSRECTKIRFEVILNVRRN